MEFYDGHMQIEITVYKSNYLHWGSFFQSCPSPLSSWLAPIGQQLGFLLFQGNLIDFPSQRSRVRYLPPPTPPALKKISSWCPTLCLITALQSRWWLYVTVGPDNYYGLQGHETSGGCTNRALSPLRCRYWEPKAWTRLQWLRGSISPQPPNRYFLFGPCPNAEHIPIRWWVVSEVSRAWNPHLCYFWSMFTGIHIYRTWYAMPGLQASLDWTYLSL